MAKGTTFIGLDTHKVATQVAMLLRGTEAPVDRERMNERSGTVIAVALTSQEPGAHFPLTLESKAPGLPIRSWIKISQIRTLATERIGRKIARASDEGRHPSA